MPEVDVFNTCMRDCFGSCSMVTSVEDGRVARVRGNPDHPITRGYLCFKMRDVAGQHRHRDRLLQPLVRTGPKGSGEFRTASWDEALAIVADRLGGIAAREPGDVLQFCCGGNMGVLSCGFPERFFNRLGATGVIETICNTAGRRALEYVYGTCHGQDPEVIPGLDLLVAWGANPAWSNPHGFGLMGRMIRSGGELVVIDPVSTATARAGSHLAVRPGTDYQLAMGLVHVLAAEDLIDEDAVAGRVLGHEQLVEAARAYTPRRVGTETGLGQEAVLGLARRLAAAGDRVLVLIGWGLQRRRGGGEAVRAIAFIPALLGLGRRGFIYSNNAYGFDDACLEARHLDGGRPRVNMMEVGRLLAAGRFGAFFCYSANPMASLANLGVLGRGLEREDLFTVVHDIYLTDTALRADVVLPATHFLESEDIRPSYYHRYLGYNARAVEPAGEAVDNRGLFRRLAAAMGLDDPELHEPDGDLMRRALDCNSRLDDARDLKTRGFAALELPDLSRALTPSGRIELVSGRARAAGAGDLPRWDGERPPGPGQLNLLTPVHRDVLRSQDHDAPLHLRPQLTLNPGDAAQRGIGDGDPVEASNARGSARLTARLSASVPPGVAVAYSSPWPRLARGGTVNFLTPDDVQDHGGGSTYNSARITVSPVSGGG